MTVSEAIRALNCLVDCQTIYSCRSCGVYELKAKYGFVGCADVKIVAREVLKKHVEELEVMRHDTYVIG